MPHPSLRCLLAFCSGAFPWLLVLAPTAACGAAGPTSVASPGQPVGPGEAPPRAEAASSVAVNEGQQAPMDAPPTTAAPRTTPTPAVAEDAELAVARRMVDIEAHVRIEVERVAESAQRLRDLAIRSDGRVASETTTEDSPSTAHAEFTLRVPVGKADDVFRALDGLGVVRARDVHTRDIGKDYYDSVLRLRNLQVTRDRLEQVLKQASAVSDILTVETELTRIRGEMEQIQGQLRYMKDRAAFATLFVTLFTRAPEQPVEEIIVKPHARFFPGVQGGYLLDVRGSGTTAGYYGGGFGIGFSRQLELQFGGYRRIDDARGALDAFTATLGGRFHSEYLGGGTRRFLEPYLGVRGGYARFEGRNEVVTGITLGLELFKSETVRTDLGVQGLVLFGTSDGAHAAVVPTLGVDVAF